MRRSRSIETALGTALLLGPLAYTVISTPSAPQACPVQIAQPTPEVIEVAGVCEPAPAPVVAAEEATEAANEPIAPAVFMVAEGAVVLDTEADPRLASRLEVSFDFDSTELTVEGRVDSPSMAAWGNHVGQRFALYSADARVCTVELATPKLRLNVFGDIDWLLDGEDERAMWSRAWDLRADERAPDTELEAVLGSLLGERLARQSSMAALAGWKLIDGACDDAVLAAPAGVDLTLWGGAELHDETTIDGFRATNEVADARRYFDAEAEAGYAEGGETWVQHEAETLSLERWTDGTSTLITAEVGVSEDCGGFDTLVRSISTDGGSTWSEGFGEADAVWTVAGETFVLTSWGEHASIQALGGESLVSYSPSEFYGCPC